MYRIIEYPFVVPIICLFLAVLLIPPQTLASELCTINVQDFPYQASGDGLSDDTDEIQAAISAASLLENPVICFPSASGYLVSSTISIPAGISVLMDAPLLFNLDELQAGLVVGEPGIDNGFRRLRLSVRKLTNSTWIDEKSVGIRLINLIDSNIHIARSQGFTIGLQLLGSGRGLAHNHFELGYLVANKVGIDITNEIYNSSNGWVNENIFLKGHFGSYSNLNLNSSRYGIRFAASDETRANNNLFIQPSFELLQSYINPPAEAVPILMENGMLNRFESCRDEENSTTFARVSNNSQLNEFDVGRGGKPFIEDTSVQKTSFGSSRNTRLTDLATTEIFNSGPLHHRANPYNQAGDLNVAGVHIITTSNDTAHHSATGLAISNDYLEVPTNRGIGVFVDTSVYKRFIVRRGTVPGYGGRINVRPYDSNDNLITGAEIGNISSYRSYFGGSYYEGADSNTDRYFTVPEEAKTTVVFLTGGSSPLRIRSFSITSVDGGSPSVWTGYEEAIPGANLAVEAPNAACTIGAISLNAEPAAGEMAGWICTGASGQWSGFGQITH